MRKYLYMVIFALVMLIPITEASAKDIAADIDVNLDANVSTEAYENMDEEDTGILNLDIIQITAGLTKEQEVTFDKVRNISGEAEEGTVLTFSVYQDEEQEEKEVYSQSVGASGLFSQLIELKEGKNFIEIFVEQSDTEETFLFEVDRKKEEIKKELEDVKINNILSEDEKTIQDTVLKSLLK